MAGRTLQVIVEELVFRVALPVLIGVVASAVLFGVIHKSQDRETVGAAIVMAFLLSWLYAASGSILVCMAAHGAVNLYAVRGLLRRPL